MYEGLPEACLTLMPSDGKLIDIERGQSGYHTSNWDTGNRIENRKIADHYNEKRGVSKAQEEAMLIGSMLGWDVPASDPRFCEDLPALEVNVGYAIIRRETISGIEIVLGESTSESGMYVTWRRTPAHEHQGKPEYYWGHYFNSKSRAVTDFDSRVEEVRLQSKEYIEEKSSAASKKRNEPER